MKETICGGRLPKKSSNELSILLNTNWQNQTDNAIIIIWTGDLHSISTHTLHKFYNFRKVLVNKTSTSSMYLWQAMILARYIDNSSFPSTENSLSKPIGRSWHTFCANCCTMCLTVASFIEHNLIVLYSNCNHSVWWIYCILLCLSVFSLKWPPTHFCRILTSKGAQCLSDQESPRRENHIIQQNEKLGHVPDIRWKT